MKKYFFLLIVISILTSCSFQKSPETDFEKCMKIIEEYDNFQGLINDTILARFYFATEYLQRITNIEANFVHHDIPHYKTKEDCKEDLRNWRKWYDENNDYLTKKKSDSLKREIAKDNIWWSDSTILKYVFEIE